MIHFELNEKEYQFPENWDEVTLGQYVNIGRLQEERLDYNYSELYLLRLIEILASAEEGELDDLSLEMVNKLGEATTFVSTQPDYDKSNEFWIDDVLYTPPTDLTKLSIGEFISLKTYQDGSKNIWEGAPWMLAILWRPTEKVIDKETKKEVLKREKFNVENLEWRKNEFLKQPAIKIFGPLLFFSTTKGGFTQNIKDYTHPNQKTEVMDDPAGLKLTEDILG